MGQSDCPRLPCLDRVLDSKEGKFAGNEVIAGVLAGSGAVFVGGQVGDRCVPKDEQADCDKGSVVVIRLQTLLSHPGCGGS